MNTKVCKECERELPLERFSRIKGGIQLSICKECVSAIRKENRERKLAKIEEQRNAYFKEFEGKEPCDVLQLMGRAKKWLEARGYEITLRGTITLKKDVKFD